MLISINASKDILLFLQYTAFYFIFHIFFLIDEMQTATSLANQRVFRDRLHPLDA